MTRSIVEPPEVYDPEWRSRYEIHIDHASQTDFVDCRFGVTGGNVICEGVVTLDDVVLAVNEATRNLTPAGLEWAMHGLFSPHPFRWLARYPLVLRLADRWCERVGVMKWRWL